MALIKENITKAITMLEDLLMNCVDKETTIRIHGIVDGFTVRYSSVLDEFHVDYEELCLVCGWFEVDIRQIITDISYSEEENSVHIVFSKGELYLDLE